ncbi:type II toxin-antitoxin system HicA family toxin [Streptomyces sp. BI20]|uniref:type II toxin-antitoxin system HicA family toxin n=1 Tax=Streptomyces sp. BI20 TaxID=3403460 RepID=UPI003C741774
MKKRDLLRTLRAIASEKGVDLVWARTGGSHEIWTLRTTRLVVPRHNEIAEGTARSIIRAAKGA